MGTRGVQNGTPVTGDWLCRTCSYAQIQKGYAESEELIHCTFRRWEQPQLIPFRIRECTAYADRRRSDLDGDGMEKTAWILVTKRAGRSVGFVTAKEFKKIEGEDAEVIP
ncbi:MAG TPA: hypothetical protein VG860_22045 [Terriglobia bacterium]|jgi:hypothetical protein|nr:hypothetical protein [Terriglobia bacterium]